MQTDETFVGRTECQDDDVLKALPFLSYDRALDACKLLVEKWIGEASYWRTGPKKQKWELIEPPVDITTRKPTTRPRWRLTLATASNQYHIHVSPTYLGCVVVSRVIAPGEKHSGGNDLRDGQFNRITWANILCGIFSYELVEIPKQEAGETIPDFWSFIDKAAGQEKAEWAVEHEKSRMTGLHLAAGDAAPQVVDPQVDPHGHLSR